MDAPLTPPVRIQPLESTPISLKEARKNITDFIADYHQRTAATHAANNTVTVQLEKLAKALKEERKAQRKEAEKE